MFNPITIPFGAVMLYNVVKLKPGVTTDDVEMAIGEMCNTVKNTYGNDEGGFIGGQVFEYSGFVSAEGSFDPERKSDEHIAIVTYWQSFEHFIVCAPPLSSDNSFLFQRLRETADICYDEKMRQKRVSVSL